MRPSHAAPLALLAFVLAWTAPLAADDQPLVVGGEGVPTPKKTKHVQPVYPEAARARGIRGIVILNLVIDTRGRVASTSVVRSVPGLDEAAIGAARQWEYEPVKVAGKLVSVSMTVPITFTLPLPQLVRAGGVPELRQGTTPVYPARASGDGLAAVEVTLDADGQVEATRVVDGVEPWTGALVEALKTWRFTAPEDDAVLSFRVEAAFSAAGGSASGKVALKAGGVRRAELLSAAQPAAAPAPPVAAAPPAPGTPPAAAAPVPGTAGGAVAATPGAQAAAPGAEPPPVEVITAPAPPAPAENGISVVRDVTLAPGVPELARGRRPVAPPLARMAGSSGSVEVAFSVGASGSTLVQSVAGPDLLKKPAEEAVASWVFRRTRADRAYLLAVFTYGGDKASAVVRPQPSPAPAAAPAPEPMAPPAASVAPPQTRPASPPQP